MDASESVNRLAGTPRWRMPITRADYDRGPLTPVELAALEERRSLADGRTGSSEARAVRATLRRLIIPLVDVQARFPLTNEQHGALIPATTALCNEMLGRRQAFWQWSTDDWIETIAPTPTAYTRRHFAQYGYSASAGRGPLRMMAYFLGGVSDLRAAGMRKNASLSAEVAFGADLIAREQGRIRTVLTVGEGYSDGHTWARLRTTLSVLALLNRSPYLEDLSLSSLIEMATKGLTVPYRTDYYLVRHIARALHVLHILTDEAYGRIPRHVLTGEQAPGPDTHGIAPEWAAWCVAWRRAVSDLEVRVRANYYTDALAAGRWLLRTHPSITTPEHWTVTVAREFVGYVCQSGIGADAPEKRQETYARHGQLGQPIGPTRMDARLASMRRVFSDWQDTPHAVAGQPPRRITLHVKPYVAFRTPQTVQRQLQPHPRDIDLTVWHKLMGAAARLTGADLGPHDHYPLAFVRAAALLWVTSARRPNEIARLRVGCVRRDWDTEMRDDAGHPIARDAQFTYLLIPAGKTRGPFWIPIPAFTGDAIEAWETERPSGQPALRDPKDGRAADVLFCYRNARMGREWLSTVLIPVLCRVANVETADALGRFTPHRGRSTIATLLRRSGVPLDSISAFLGHSSPEMVRRYVRDDPHRHARTMRQADVLVRTMLGLYDPNAAGAGLPSVFFYLAYGADKRPRLCASPQHLACPHRLRCVQCAMFLDAEEAEQLERKPGVLHINVPVPMAAEDVALETGNTAVLDAILDERTALPPPEPPNPAFRINKWVGCPEEEVPTSYLISSLNVHALDSRRATLVTELERLARNKKDNRNRLVTALKQQIQEIEEAVAALTIGNKRDDMAT